MSDCTGTLTVHNQESLDGIVDFCTTKSTCVAAITGTLVISDYTDEKLSITAPSSISSKCTFSFSVSYGINITGGSSLQSIDLSGTSHDITIGSGSTGYASIPQYAGSRFGDAPGSGLVLSDLPKLSSFNATMAFVSAMEFHKLPQLESAGLSSFLEFSSNLTQPALVLEETGLLSLDTSSLNGSNPDLGDLVLQNNAKLQSVNMGDGAKTISGDLRIMNTIEVAEGFSFVGKEIVSIDGNLEVETTGDVAMALLQNVTGDVTISNMPANRVQAVSLETVGGNLTMVNMMNEDSRLQFDTLKTVGGSVVWSMNAATEFVGLTALQWVNGSIVIEGPVTDIEFPALTHVGDSVHINSTNGFDCSSLDLVSTGALSSQDKYSCHSSKLNTTAAAPEPASSKGGSSLKKVLTGTGIGLVSGIVLILVSLFLLRRRRRRAAAEKEQWEKDSYFGRVEMDGKTGPTSRTLELTGECVKPRELHGDTPVVEPQELDGESVAQFGLRETEKREEESAMDRSFKAFQTKVLRKPVPVR